MFSPIVFIQRFLPAVLLTSYATAFCLAQAGTQSLITGTWRGTSECIQLDTPCHDEVNVYRFSQIAGKPNSFSGTGSKVVDGKEIPMGTLQWTYDTDKHALESEVSGSTFRLVVMGNKIEGTLTSDKIVYRRIHLQRTLERAN